MINKQETAHFFNNSRSPFIAFVAVLFILSCQQKSATAGELGDRYGTFGVVFTRSMVSEAESIYASTRLTGAHVSVSSVNSATYKCADVKGEYDRIQSIIKELGGLSFHRTLEKQNWSGLSRGAIIVLNGDDAVVVTGVVRNQLHAIRDGKSVVLQDADVQSSWDGHYIQPELNGNTKFAPVTTFVSESDFALPAKTFVVPSIKMGKVAPNVKIVRQFDVRNDSADEIAIGRVQTSCGCTSIQLGNAKALPKQSLGTAIVFDSTGFAGSFEKKAILDLESRAGGRARIVVMISGEVDTNHRMYCLPPEVLIKTRLPRSSDELGGKSRVVVYRDGNVPVALLSVESSEPWLLAKPTTDKQPYKMVAGRDGSGDRRTILTEIVGNLSPGMHHAFIRVNTSDRLAPSIIVPINVGVASPYDIRPAAIFRKMDGRTVSPSPVDVDVVGVSTPFESVSATVEPAELATVERTSALSESGNRTQLKLRLASVIPEGSSMLTGRLKLTINGPVPMEATIPITLYR